MDQLNIAKSRVSSRPVSSDGQNYVSELLMEAMTHPALNHEWLTHVANSDYPDMRWALHDYAYQYHAYASEFPSYLSAVIDKLDDPDHKSALLHNLNEEKGRLNALDTQIVKSAGIDADALDGVAHSKLYNRFCYAIGLTADDLATPAPAGLAWRQQLTDYLQQAPAAAAVGAIGLGTESVVKPIYKSLIKGIQTLDLMDRADYVFFELHCIVDDQHALDLNRIASDLLATETLRGQVREGMLTALDLRNRFWDCLHDRAMERHNDGAGV